MGTGSSGVLRRFTRLVSMLREKDGSDIHIQAGEPARLRVDGDLVSAEKEPWSRESMVELALALMGGNEELFKKRMEDVRARGDADFAARVQGVSFRCNLYRTLDGLALAARLIPQRIWSIEEIGLPESVLGYCDRKQGLIILAGPTGSGKTTTLATMVDYINETYPYHIVTIEDPVEYRIPSKRSVVSQREVGTNAASFNDALVAALRQDPDVIMVGEMRDRKTMETAIRAAETGHLVLTTLHTSSAEQTVDRIVNLFAGDEQRQVRMSLSAALVAVICQKLLPRADGKGRVLAYEIMGNNREVFTLIWQGKTHQLENAIYTARAESMVLMDDTLRSLLRKGIITEEVALAACNHPESFFSV